LQQLIRSLDDLDAEYEAGDLDRGAYEALRNDYTVRVADAVRRRSGGAATSAADGSTIDLEAAPEGDPGPMNRGRIVVVAALLVFAVGAGWLLARSAGERGLGEALTGNIDPSSRQRVIECQELGAVEGLVLEAIQCFDDVLATEPDNVEALTYRAWFLVLASGAESDVAQAQRDELLSAAVVYLDRAIDVDPDYPDARAFRAVVADRQGDSDRVCSQITELRALEPPPFFLELTDPVAERNNCA
jgi:hypothetical protein